MPKQAVRRIKSGFTLIELMVTIAIIGILAAIAFPSYRSYILKSRRADAWAGLFDYQQDLEKWRVNNTSYSGCPTSVCAAPASDWFSYSVSGASATGYTLTATALSAQTADTGCTAMTLNQNGDRAPADCWKK